MPFEFFPNTNFHDLNLDYILEKAQNIDSNKEAAESAAESAANDAAKIADILATLDNDVIAYVDNWLVEHISGAGTALDTSFTLENAAAQSAAVGNALYANSNRDNLLPAGFTRFNVALSEYTSDNPLDIYDMPINAYAYASTDRFSNIPNDTPSACWIFSLRSPYNSAQKLFVICNPITGYFKFGTGTSADNVSWSAIENAETLHIQPSGAREIFVKTDFSDKLLYWYTASGALTPGINPDLTLYHSKPVRINESDYIYISSLNTSTACVGAWLDKYGEWLAPISPEDFELVEYKKGYSPTSYNFAPLYRTQAPASAAFISWNLRLITEAQAYEQYIANVPVLVNANFPDMRFNESDPTYAALHDKKVCVIGPSTVYLDRAQVPALNNQALCSWLEYLRPFCETVDNFSVNGGAWRNVSYTANGVTYPSIYQKIVAERADISGYDIYILAESPNCIDYIDTDQSRRPGAYIGNTASDTPDTYVGALHATIDYIYSLNPDAQIFNMTIPYKGTYYTSTTRKIDTDYANTMIAAFSRKLGVPVIDIAAGLGCNDNTVSTLTYDGIHWNQYGSRVFGLYALSAIVSPRSCAYLTPSHYAVSAPSGASISSNGNIALRPPEADCAIISAPNNRPFTVFKLSRSGTSNIGRVYTVPLTSTDYGVAIYSNTSDIEETFLITFTNIQ